jgi:hypothetical protein
VRVSLFRMSPLQFATLLLASIFVARAALRLAQPEFNVLRFAVLGWSPWAVWVVSSAELAGAALLLHVSSFRIGAGVLALVCIAFVWVYASVGVPEAGLGSAGLLAAIIGLVMLRGRGSDHG